MDGSIVAGSRLKKRYSEEFEEVPSLRPKRAKVRDLESVFSSEDIMQIWFDLCDHPVAIYDLVTATMVYRNRINPNPIFLTSEASPVGGFYAVNRHGQALLATVNESTFVPFISGQISF